MKKPLMLIISFTLMPITISCSDSFDKANIEKNYSLPSSADIEEVEFDDYANAFYLYSSESNLDHLSMNDDNSLIFETYREINLRVYHKNNQVEINETNVENYISFSSHNKSLTVIDTYNRLYEQGCFCKTYRLYFSEPTKNAVVKINYNNQKTYKFSFNVTEYSTFEEDYLTPTQSQVERQTLYESIKTLKVFNPVDYNLIKNEINQDNKTNIKITNDHKDIKYYEYLETINLKDYYKLINKSMFLPESFDVYSLFDESEYENLIYYAGRDVASLNIRYDREIINEQDFKNAKITDFTLSAFIRDVIKPTPRQRNRKLWYGHEAPQYYLGIDNDTPVYKLIMKNKDKLYTEKINGIDVVFYVKKDYPVRVVYEYNSDYYTCSSISKINVDN